MPLSALRDQNASLDNLYVARPPIMQNGHTRIRRLLIANRGEIACRIITTCQSLGITSIAVFTDEDRDSLHVKAADEAICIGPIDQQGGSNPHQNAALLVQTALDASADAVHPGYGYLSENTEFAKAVQDAQLIFVGPSPYSISILGDKRQAKDFLQKNAPQVPLIPGYSGTTQDPEELEAEATKIGFPVMLKASAGGGGRGMRIVHGKEDLRGELSRAQSEAQRSFGSSDCLLEKYIQRGKHIEIQIIGDSSGQIVSLLDRECSIQRRHQKIIEEAPSVWLPDTLRHDMIEAAKAICGALKYENAGTVEFIVDVDSARFYFLEVNTRIQVEHAITEETTGVDIVALQLFVAGGGLLADCKPLADVHQSGHSIECRICAEDPAREFMPDSGLILRWNTGKDLLDARKIAGVRVETAVQSGSHVTSFFDSMIAKIIVKDVDRPSAIQKMLNVLQNTICIGVKTNLSFLQACLVHPDFHRVDYTTNFIQDRIETLLQNPYTKDIRESLASYSFVPALFIRFLADRSRDPASYRPFRSIQSGFRNQVYDSSNTAADLVTADVPNTSQSETISHLFTWVSKRNHAEKTYHYKSRPISQPNKDNVAEGSGKKDSKPGIDLIRSYNAALVNHQQQSQPDSQEHTVRIVQFTVQEQVTASKRWLTGDMTVDSDGKMQQFYLSTDSSFTSKGAGAPQRVFLHIPELGTSFKFLRYTLLAYGESLRAQFGIDKAADELRTYKSFMPCKVLRILKKNGDAVKKGETLLIVESMKTEMKVTAKMDGTFEGKVKELQAVDSGVTLCEIQ